MMDGYFKISNYLDQLMSRDLTVKEIEGEVLNLLVQARDEHIDLKPILIRKLVRTRDPLMASLIALILQRLNGSSTRGSCTGTPPSRSPSWN